MDCGLTHVPCHRGSGGNGNRRAYCILVWRLRPPAECGLNQGGPHGRETTHRAVATSLALLQIQLNAVRSLLQAQHPTLPVREQIQQLVDEGVEMKGLETMQRF